MKLVTEHDLNARSRALQGYMRVIETTNADRNELDEINRQINGINQAIDMVQNIPKTDIDDQARAQKIKIYQDRREQLAAQKFNLLSAPNNASNSLINTPAPARSQEEQDIQALRSVIADPNASEDEREQAIAILKTYRPSTSSDSEPAPAASAKSAPAASAKSAPAKLKPRPDPKIRELQQKLNQMGANLEVDGIMGPRTRAAQQRYQSQLNAPAKTAKTSSPASPAVNGNYPTPPQTQSSYAAPPAGNYPSNPNPSRMPLPGNYTTRPKQGGSDVDRALGAFAATESVSYNEDQTLARIIGLAGI